MRNSCSFLFFEEHNNEISPIKKLKEINDPLNLRIPGSPIVLGFSSITAPSKHQMFLLPAHDDTKVLNYIHDTLCPLPRCRLFQHLMDSPTVRVFGRTSKSSPKLFSRISACNSLLRSRFSESGSIISYLPAAEMCGPSQRETISSLRLYAPVSSIPSAETADIVSSSAATPLLGYPGLLVVFLAHFINISTFIRRFS